MSGWASNLEVHGSRIAVSLLVIVVAGVTCAAAFALGPGPGAAQDMFSSARCAVAGGSLRLEAQALTPGQRVTGSALVRNEGDAPGRFYLGTDRLVDRPGAGGGSLADVLTVEVVDVSSPDEPLLVYSGSPGGLSGIDLGTFAQGAARSYRVIVWFPQCDVDSEVFAGSSLDLGLQWTAVTLH
jgi:hypothetical protein